MDAQSHETDIFNGRNGVGAVGRNEHRLVLFANIFPAADKEFTPTADHPNQFVVQKTSFRYGKRRRGGGEYGLSNIGGNEVWIHEKNSF